jgi:hypothetical protein
MTPIKPIRCLRDVVDLPPSAFALRGDGRQQKHLCRQRKALTVILARYANADGSGAYPAAQTVGKAMGCHRSTVFRLLKDLQELGFETDGRLVCYRGGRDRTLHVARMQAVASSPGSESHLRGSGVASSRAEVAKEDATQPPLGPPLRPEGEEPVPALTPLALAQRLLEQIHLPITRANLTAVAATIEAIQMQRGHSYPECCEWLASRVAAARGVGAKVNRFWFEDANYNEPNGGKKANANEVQDRELAIVQSRARKRG